MAQARLVFRQIKYCQGNCESDEEKLAEEIRKLAQNMIRLEEKNLSIVNNKLMKSGRKVCDFLTEHLFAVELIERNPDAQIEYEPDYMDKPIDFVIKQDGISFWLQIKRLSALECENRQEKTYRKSKEQLENINIPLFISIFISEEFNEQDVTGLLDEIKRNASIENIEKTFQWPSNEKTIAEYEFILPNKITLCYLKLGIWGDINSIDITGQDANQIKGSLEKASKAINRNSDRANINLIVMGADDKEDTDIAEACFGTECYRVRSGVEIFRENDGFFYDAQYSSKITGVIALRRREHRPISTCEKTLFINPSFKEDIDSIKKIIEIDHIILL